MSTLNFTWGPPLALDALDLTNCTEAVYIWKSYKGGNGIDYDWLADKYLLNGLQGYLKANNLVRPDIMGI